MEDKEIKIVTHSSGYHTDDVFAVATLSLFLEDAGKKYSITRSRDMSIIEEADYVADVGGIYDERKNRFDHHQEGGAGKRENDVPYAAFGLVWKKFGPILCGNEKVSNEVDRILIQPIDANDNGVQFSKPIFAGLVPYDIGALTWLFQPTWKEETSIYDVFIMLVGYAKVILKRQILVAQHDIEGERIVIEQYSNAEDKRLIETDPKLPWEEVLSRYKEPLFVMYRNMDSNWTLKTIRNDIFSFESRKDLPQSWAGKSGSDLENASGIDGAVFCHNGKFMCVAKSREAILKMAEIALKE